MHVLENGICVTCQPDDHELVDGVCEACSDREPLSEEEQALVTALDELGVQHLKAARAWDPAKHPRGPGGKFRSIVDRLKESIEKHHRGDGDGHPFDGYSREQLRRVAKARGIELKRGEDRDSIAEKLLGHLGKPPAEKPTPKVMPSTPHHDALGKPGVGNDVAEAALPLSKGQADALLPKRGGWTTTTRAGTVAALKKTPEGRNLLQTVDSFQSGSSANIPRLRTDIEKVLAGDTSLAPGRVDSVKNLLGAIAQSDAGDRPLFRGMVAPLTVDEVLARYRTGGTLDLSLASFSSDKKLATEFSIKGAGQKVTGKTRTPVVIEWLTGPKHALPVENLSKSRVFSNEKEWIGAGHYNIIKASTRTRQGVTTVVLQVEQVSTW